MATERVEVETARVPEKQTPRRPHPAAGGTSLASNILALQRSAGNRAVMALLDRGQAPTPAPVAGQPIRRVPLQGSFTAWGAWGAAEDPLWIEILDLWHDMVAVQKELDQLKLDNADKAAVDAINEVKRTIEAIVTDFDNQPLHKSDAAKNKGGKNATGLRDAIEQANATAEEALETGKSSQQAGEAALAKAANTTKPGQSAAKKRAKKKKSAATATKTGAVEEEPTAKEAEPEPTTEEMGTEESQTGATTDPPEPETAPSLSTEDPVTETPTKKRRKPAPKVPTKSPKELAFERTEAARIANEKKRTLKQARTTRLNHFKTRLEKETADLYRIEKMSDWHWQGDVDRIIGMAKRRVDAAGAGTVEAIDAYLTTAYEEWKKVVAAQRETNERARLGSIESWRGTMGLSEYAIHKGKGTQPPGKEGGGAKVYYDLANATVEHAPHPEPPEPEPEPVDPLVTPEATTATPEVVAEPEPEPEPEPIRLPIHITYDWNSVRLPTGSINSYTTGSVLQHLLGVTIPERIHATLETDEIGFTGAYPHVYWPDFDLGQGIRYRGLWATVKPTLVQVLKDYVDNMIQPRVAGELKRLQFKPYDIPALAALLPPKPTDEPGTGDGGD